MKETITLSRDLPMSTSTKKSIFSGDSGFKTAGNVLFVFTCGILAIAGLTYGGNNIYLNVFYIAIMIGIALVGEMSTSRGFYEYQSGSKKTGVVMVFFGLAVSVSLIFVHWNFFNSSLSKGLNDHRVEITEVQQNRSSRIEELKVEYSRLSEKIESPDFGSKSIEQSIALAAKNSESAVRQGSTTNGMKMISEVSVLQDKLAQAKEKEVEFVKNEQLRRDARIREITSEISALQAAIVSTSKTGSELSSISPDNVWIIALAAAILIKAGSFICMMIAGRSARSSSSISPKAGNPADAEGVRAAAPKAPMEALPSVQAHAPTPATPIAIKAEDPIARVAPGVRQPAACAAPARRDERFLDLVSAQPAMERATSPVEAVEPVQEGPVEVAQEESPVGVEDPAMAEAEAEQALPEVSAEDDLLTVEAVVSGAPSKYQTYYRALLAYMKDSHPRSERLPVQGIPELSDVSLGKAKMVEVYQHAKSLGLLEQNSSGHYRITSLIDELVV